MSWLASLALVDVPVAVAMKPLNCSVDHIWVEADLFANLDEAVHDLTVVSQGCVA